MGVHSSGGGNEVVPSSKVDSEEDKPLAYTFGNN